MKKTVLLSIALIVSGIIYSQSNKVGVKIKMFEFHKEDLTETIHYIKTEYFEVDLSLMPKGNYKANKSIVKLTLDNPNYSKFFVMIDEKSEVLFFDNSTSFLNYMSKRGYSLLSQSKSKYKTEYTFKLK